MSGLPKTGNAVRQAACVTRAQHQALSGHQGAVLWLTGMPGSGKSTIARAAQQQLRLSGYRTVLLDGDHLRHGLCADLDFSVADRNENVRRVGEVSRLFLETGVIVLVALASPLRAAREAVRKSLPAGVYLEIHCQCPVSVCRQRDPQGHDAQADKGHIALFTGLSSPYEAPLLPALRLYTGVEQVAQSADRLTQWVLCHMNQRRHDPIETPPTAELQSG